MLSRACLESKGCAEQRVWQCGHGPYSLIFLCVPSVVMACHLCVCAICCAWCVMCVPSVVMVCHLWCVTCAVQRWQQIGRGTSSAIQVQEPRVCSPAHWCAKGEGCEAVWIARPLACLLSRSLSLSLSLQHEGTRARGFTPPPDGGGSVCTRTRAVPEHIHQRALQVLLIVRRVVRNEFHQRRARSLRLFQADAYAQEHTWAEG